MTRLSAFLAKEVSGMQLADDVTVTIDIDPVNLA
jgi:hypothetical protein